MRIRQLFSSPVFADQEQTRRARLLHLSIWSLLLVANSQFWVGLVVLPQHWPRWLGSLLALNLTLPPLSLLNRRGRTAWAGVLLLTALWLLATARALTGGGIHAPFVLAYIVDVLIAGLVFGGKGGMFMGIICCLTALGFVLLERTGLLPASRVTPTPLSLWVNLASFLEFMVVFQFLANRSITAALEQAERAETALRRSHEELEARVQERTAELRTANAELQEVNKELEAFSYSVSHDLRSPLRAVLGFTELLLAGHAANLHGDAQSLLARIKERAGHMNQLVEALLSLARVGRQQLVPRSVNLTSLVRQVLAELQAEERDRNMDIRVADLPDCLGDPALLRQVFINLLSNAVKYTRTRPVATIEVGFKTQAAKTIYFVRDNGAGFDMRDADKLFGVFQRLHSAEQFEGTGVGLSIVRRIIHRHEGEIWVEAAVDQGATFHFTLPPAPP